MDTEAGPYSACCNNVFSLWQTTGYRYHDCTKFGQLILSKILVKIVATTAVKFYG